MSEDNSSAKPADDSKKVIVYSTNWCAYCKMVKQYLTGRGVAFVEKNIEDDAEAHKELMDKIGGNFVRVNAPPEQVVHLLGEDDYGNSSGETDNHGVRDKLDNAAEFTKSHHDQDNPRHDCSNHQSSDPILLDN